MAASPSGWVIYPEKSIIIQRSLNIPIMDIDVGFPQLGSYQVILWRKLASGKYKKVGKIRSGDTGDAIPDEFRITNKKANLSLFNDRLMTWVVTLQKMQSGPVPFSFELEFTQSGGPSKPVVLLDHAEKNGSMKSYAKGFRGSYHVSVVA